MTKELEQQLNFLIEIDKMKNVLRQTVLVDRSRQETDAEHSWHMAMTALVLREYAGDSVDINRVIQMALVHDLVEIYAGDTFAYDTKGYEDKEAREREAANRLFAILPTNQAAALRGLWEEFERMETSDAQYAAAVDRLQPFINNYMTKGHTWVKHGVTTEQIYARMKPVTDTLPVLKEFIDKVVREACENGYVKPQGHTGT